MKRKGAPLFSPELDEKTKRRMELQADANKRLDEYDSDLRRVVENLNFGTAMTPLACVCCPH